MKPRHRDNVILLRRIEFCRLLCSKMGRRNSISPDDVPQEDAPVRNISSHWNDKTITSTSPAEVYDYAIKFPSLPASASSTSEPNLLSCSFTHLRFLGQGSTDAWWRNLTHSRGYLYRTRNRTNTHPKTWIRTNTNPNGTEADASGRSARECVVHDPF